MSEVELNRKEHNFTFFGSQKVRRCNNCNELENSASEFCHTRASLLDDVAKLRQQLEAAQCEVKRLESAWHAGELNRKDEIISRQEAENDRLKAIIKKAQEQEMSGSKKRRNPSE